MPSIPRDHLTFYGTLQRLVTKGDLPAAVARAVIRAAEVVRENRPSVVAFAKLGGLADLSALPAALRLDEALSTALQAGDVDAVVRAVFNRELEGEELARALREGRFQEVLERATERNLYASALAGVREPIRSIALRAAAVAIEELPRPAGLISRAAVEVRATAAASKRAGDLVTNATRETQLAVRELAEQALMEGRDVRQAARTIREVIGLNRQQAKSFDKFISEAMGSDAYKSAAGVQRAIDREYSRLINRRADTIARTELWQAGQDGQMAVWQEAKASGAMDIRGLEALFRSKIGEEARGPLIHPGCLCSVRLRTAERDGNRFYVREWVTSPRNPCERCLAFQGARAMP